MTDIDWRAVWALSLLTVFLIWQLVVLRDENRELREMIKQLDKQLDKQEDIKIGGTDL